LKLDRNIWRVYAATLVLGIAYGLSVSVIALHLDDLGFKEQSIGGLAAWFALGIVLLSIPAGKLVHTFGGKRTLVLALAGYAFSAAIFPWLTSFRAIAAARFLDGACSACIWVSCETVLLRRSGEKNKAQVMSLYAVAMGTGYVVGPLVARGLVTVLPMRMAFLATAILASIASAYVALRLDPEGRAGASGGEGKGEGERAGSSVPIGTLVKRIRTSCFATFSYGYFEASVVLFLPLYLMHEKGISREGTVVIPAFFAAGMLLFTNVSGRLGDRFGHLLLMRVLASVGTAMVLGFIGLRSFGPMAAAVFVAGATLASMSAVSLALLGVVTEPREIDRANGVYNAFYAAGILLGPPVTSVVFAHLGGTAMLLHLAALWAAFVVFAFVHAGDDPARARRARALAPSTPPSALPSAVLAVPSPVDEPESMG
jgi:MFS family permease